MKRLLLVPLILALSLPSFADDHTYTYKGKTYKSNRLDKETLQRIKTVRLDRFTHKGKEYIASRECEEGRSMQWMTYPSFLGIGGRVEELGCMNRLEHERYMRNYRAGIDSRPVIINNPAPITQPSSRPMLIPMYQKPINCTGVNYGGAGFSATCN